MNVYKGSRVLFCAVGLACLAACTSDGGDGDIESDPGDAASIELDEQSLSAVTDEDGIATFSFEVNVAAKALQLAVYPGAAYQAKLVSLSDNLGPVNLEPLDANFRGAKTLASSVNVLNFPFSPFNTVRTAYTATYQLFDPLAQSPVPFTEIEADILTNKDRDLNSGTVAVNIVLAGPVAGSEDVGDSLEAVVSTAESLLAAGNLSLDISWVPYPGPDLLPNPNFNDPYYENLSKAVRPHAVNIVFGSDVIGLSGQNSLYSISTGDPGPAVPSTRSAAVVSIFAVAGADGKFNFDGDGSSQVNSNEIRLAGEEVAQLIAHYLGVTHILENDGNITKSSDALPDTNSCLTYIDCRQQQDIRDNLMFPWPIETFEGNLSTYARVALSPQQTQILQRSVLVN